MPDIPLGDTTHPVPCLTSNPPHTHKRQSPTCDTAPTPASVLPKHRQPISFPRARWEQRPAPRRATCLSPPLLKLHILNHTDLSSPPNTSNSPPITHYIPLQQFPRPYTNIHGKNTAGQYRRASGNTHKTVIPLYQATCRLHPNSLAR